MTLIPQCTRCGCREFEVIDDTGEFIADWRLDARQIPGWDEQEETGLMAWQERKNYTDEQMEHSVEGLINSERLTGKKPVGYASLPMALQRRVRMGWDERGKVATSNNYKPRYPGKQTARY